MKQCDLDVMVARAQIALAFLFATGIFGLVVVLIFWHDAMTSLTITIVSSIISTLVTILTLQMNYFFARQRPHTPIDPPDLPDPVGDPSVPSERTAETTVTKKTTVSQTNQEN